MKVTFDEIGWFLMCPVYIAEFDTEAPHLMARWWVPDFWFTLNEWLAQGINLLGQLLFPYHYEPGFRITSTGPLDPPFIGETEDVS